MQYTIRGVPQAIDQALRERARREGTSLNQAAIDAPAEGIGLPTGSRKRRDMSDLIGSWKPDAALEEALADQDRVDPDLWR